jgi:GNAT superfamily N-acetyltransferase
MTTLEPNVRVRQAGRRDLPDIQRLYRQLQPDDPVLGEDEAARVFEKILATDGLAVYLLEKDGSVCASSYLNVTPNLTRGARPYAVIENVITEESLRGQGLGRALMREVLATAWALGCYKALLQTGSKTPATHAFYRACGFRDDDKTGYVARPPEK